MLSDVHGIASTVRVALLIGFGFPCHSCAIHGPKGWKIWFIRRKRAGVERGGHAGSIWSCVKGLQNGRSACAPACCITPSASAATSTFAPNTRAAKWIFTINQDLKTCRCSACGAREVRPRGRVERRFRALPIGSRVTTLVLPIPRVQCLACGVVRQVEIPFADPRGALQAEAHGQQPRSLSFKGALQTISRLMEQTLNGTDS
ncbi:MAG: transposase family protein [Isosphaeraceae bacterium]